VIILLGGLFFGCSAYSSSCETDLHAIYGKYRKENRGRRYEGGYRNQQPHACIPVPVAVFRAVGTAAAVGVRQSGNAPQNRLRGTE